MPFWTTKSSDVPTKLGNYKIIELIGRGGMCEVYKAEQTSLKRTVALKVLPSQMGQNKEFKKRFDIEARAISMLQHANIVDIYEYGEDDDLRYFAMQYIDGKDLGTVIRERDAISLKEILSYTKQICRAVKYAHQKNVIHRDIKPQNILLDKNKTVRLTDFGIAKIFAERDVTVTGFSIGTPEYMSPEQAEGKPLTGQSDIYSIGVVMYELLTGRPPFVGNNPVAVAYKQVHEYPVPPSAYRKDTPKRLQLIIQKALKKDLSERYKSVEGLLKDLDTVVLDDRAYTEDVIPAKEKINVYNRRITDRRSGGRRSEDVEALVGEKSTLFSWKYWKKVLKEQWLTITMLLGLTGAYVYHLYMYHL